MGTRARASPRCQIHRGNGRRRRIQPLRPPPTPDLAALPAVDAGSALALRRPATSPAGSGEGGVLPAASLAAASVGERRVREKGRRQREESERGRRRERKEIETYLLVTLSWWARRSAHPIAVSARFMWVTDTYNILKESFF